MCLGKPDVGKTTVICGQLLLDYVGFDRHPEVVSLACQVSGGVKVFAVFFEAVIPGIAP